jgi:acyl-CoA synthetase (AMP-forming)/AMP-acid ligase II
VGEGDPHVVFFTSGSTGKSKGVVLSHRCNWLRTRTPALLEPRGATVCMFPMFHMGAWTIALQAWQARGVVVFVDRAEADVLVDAVQTHRAAYMNCIPAVWRRVLEAERHSDLAEVDGDGFYSIVGRVKDVIRTGGETVSPAEVEGHLADFPGAVEVAVVGIPDDRWGEVVCAVFVLAPGVVLPTPDEVQAHLSDRVARFKHPRRIESMDAIPRTPATGQVRRREVLAAVLSAGG